MGIEAFLNHRCSIYHLEAHTTSPGYGLPGQTTYDYGNVPDLEHVPCHFSVKAETQMIQQSPMNTYLYVGKLSLPIRTDVRLNDKIVNEENGLEFYAQVPQNIRGHHLIVVVQRKGNIQANL